jgi:hypothetical protein
MTKEDKDDKKKKKGHEDVVDLAARIGARQSPPEPQPPAAPSDESPPPRQTRLDGPIPSAPKPRLVPAKEDRAQSAMIQKALVEETEKPRAGDPVTPRRARTRRGRPRRHTASDSRRLASLRAGASQSARRGAASHGVLPPRRPEGQGELSGDRPPRRGAPCRRPRLSRPRHRRRPRYVADPGHIRRRRAAPELKARGRVSSR